MSRQKAEVICAACGKIFEKEVRRIKQTEKEGKEHTCSRSCASMITNEWRKAPPSSAAAANVRRDREKFPEKTRARRLVRQALKTGKLVKPDQCEQCGNWTDVEAHHEDHSRPYLIYWLCDECHKFHDANKFTGFGTDYSKDVLE